MAGACTLFPLEQLQVCNGIEQFVGYVQMYSMGVLEDLYKPECPALGIRCKYVCAQSQVIELQYSVVNIQAGCVTVLAPRHKCSCEGRTTLFASKSFKVH